MEGVRLPVEFFSRRADRVASALLGKIIVHKHNSQVFAARIVETESYFGNKDPASRAYKGKNKISALMWEHPGTILIYNVHKYLMFNIVTGAHGKPSAVLLRGAEPLNFVGNCAGPGLFTRTLHITRKLHGANIIHSEEIYILDDRKKHKRARSFRIGVTQDLTIPHRYYIIDNKHVSKTPSKLLFKK